MVRFLCVGDLHGRLPSIPTDLAFDAILATGDFGEHSLREAKFEALRRKLDGDPIKWYDLLGREVALERIEASVESGSRVLAHLDSFGVPVFVIPGNWDWTAEESLWDELSVDRFSSMIEPFMNVRSIDRTLVEFDGVSLIGYGIVSEPELPFEKREKLSDEEWAEYETAYAQCKEHYEELFDDAKNPIILLSHTPPHDTKLDMIDRPASPRHGAHIGSLLVRELLDAHDLLACFCGHMHETAGKIDMNGTPVVNLGFGSEAWLVFDTSSRTFQGQERVERATE